MNRKYPDFRDANILIVEDEKITALDIRHTLRKYGYKNCTIASTSQEVFSLLKEQKFSIVLMDINLQGQADGIELMKEINKSYSLPVVYVSVYTDEAIFKRAALTEPLGYIPKPYSEFELRSSVEMALFRDYSEKQLASQEELLSSTLSGLNDYVFTVYEDEQIVYMNSAAREKFGVSDLSETHKLMSLFSLFEEKKDFFSLIPGKEVSLRDKDEFEGKLLLKCFDEEELIPVEIFKKEIGLLPTGFRRFVLIIRDLHATRVSSILRASYESIISSSESAILICEKTGTIRDWNRGAELLFRYSREEAVDQHVSLLSPPQYMNFLPDMIDEVTSKGESVLFNSLFQKKDNALIDVSISILPVFEEECHVQGVTLIISDISAKKKLERQVIEISEQERKRVGQDLHDSLGQNLTGTLFQIRSLQNKFEKSEHVYTEIEKIASHIQQTINMTRVISHELVPVTLEENGLKEGLLMLANNGQRLHNIEISCQIDDVHFHDSFRMTQLYRIAQEALTNIYRHSGGTHASLKLYRDFPELVLHIEDNGSGVQLGAVKGMGINIMRYRADIINGHLEIFRTEKGGTAVICRMPHQEQAPNE